MMMDQFINYIKSAEPDLRQNGIRKEDCAFLLKMLKFISNDEIHVESAEINIVYIKIWNMCVNLFMKSIDAGIYTEENIGEIMTNMKPHFVHLCNSPGMQGELDNIRKNIAIKGYAEVHLNESLSSKLIGTNIIFFASSLAGIPINELSGKLDLFLIENFYKKFREVRTFLL